MNLKTFFNILSIFIAFALCVLIVFGSMDLYLYFTNEKDNRAKIEQIDPLFSEEEFPKLDGIFLTEYLAESFKENFVGIKNVNMEFSQNEIDAYKNLLSSSVDGILVLTPNDQERKLMRDAGVDIEVRQVCHEAFVFVANKDNKVNNLSLSQVQDIFSGKITNWKDVGGDDEEIRAYRKEEGSINEDGMKSLVMGDTSMINPIYENIEEYEYKVTNQIADYDNAKNSICYGYYNYAKNTYDENNTKLLSINGVEPTKENIQNGKYPLKSGYYLVLRSDAKQNSGIRKFVDLIGQDRGKKVEEEAGYVTIR